MTPSDSENASAFDRYPEFTDVQKPTVPISFVTVHASSDLHHNLLRSECVNDPFNQLIVVDNRHNLFHDTLGESLEFGIAQAVHDVVVAVHEDVVLLPGWQWSVECRLRSLEHHDPDWAVAGTWGWHADGSARGHWRNPYGYSDLLGNGEFAEVDRLDEHLLVVRRTNRIVFDRALPSIHNIGRDVVRTAHDAGRKCYVVNAPTIHKFADGHGNRINSPDDSPKIANRSTGPFRADRLCSDFYVKRKGGSALPQEPARPRDATVILSASDRVASRLLAMVARDAGVALDTARIGAHHSIDLPVAVGGALLAASRYRDEDLRQAFVALLRRTVTAAGAPGSAAVRGVSDPGLALVLDELGEAFPNARYVHLVRDPLQTVLDWSNATCSGIDDPVGQAALVAAYRALGRHRRHLLEDTPVERAAIALLHASRRALDWADGRPRHELLWVRMEDLVESPRTFLDELIGWLGVGAGDAPAASCSPTTLEFADRLVLGRARRAEEAVRSDVSEPVADLLGQLRTRLGYSEASEQSLDLVQYLS